MGGQPLPAPKDANLEAAISAVVKATTKQVADILFLSLAGFEYVEGFNPPTPSSGAQRGGLRL